LLESFDILDFPHNLGKRSFLSTLDWFHRNTILIDFLKKVNKFLDSTASTNFPVGIM
jgi:hypothetical protein